MEWKTPGRNSRKITDENVLRPDAIVYRTRVTNQLAGLARKYRANLQESGQRFGLEQPLLDCLGTFEEARVLSNIARLESELTEAREELAALQR